MVKWLLHGLIVVLVGTLVFMLFFQGDSSSTPKPEPPPEPVVAPYAPTIDQTARDEEDDAALRLRRAVLSGALDETPSPPEKQTEDHPDIIYLSNGAILEGSIVSEDVHALTVRQTEDAEPVRIPRKQVVRVDAENGDGLTTPPQQDRTRDKNADKEKDKEKERHRARRLQRIQEAKRSALRAKKKWLRAKRKSQLQQSRFERDQDKRSASKKKKATRVIVGGG